LGKLIILLVLGAIAYTIWRVVQRGRQLARLLGDGVPTQGTVVRKYTLGRAKRRNTYLEYRYQDDTGSTHSHKSNVPAGVWAEHEEGGGIEVVYSASDPEVSAPRFLVDAARNARPVQ
jgi:hypothetical protein